MGKNKKIIIIVIAGLILISIVSYFIIKSKTKKPSYELYAVKPITIQKYIATTGTANPINTINVGAQVSGIFSKLYVWYNSTVKKGQLLAEIEPTPFIQKVDQDKANLASAEASVLKQKALLAYDNLTYTRDKKLWKENLIAHATEQNAHSVYLQDVAQLKYLSDAVNAGKAALAQDETNLSYTKIYSPVNGIIINVSVVVGQTVASTFQTPSLFTVGEDITKMEIDTTTNEADLGGIKKGDKASFTVYAYPDKTIWGYVHNVRINPTTVSGVVSYNVTIFFDNKNGLILPGMTAIAKIYVSEKKGVLGVPNSALRFIPVNENKEIMDNLSKKLKAGEGVVWILKNKMPEPVIVNLGINNDEYTEVISKDIKAGTEIITGLKSNNQTAAAPGRKMFF
ncbi:MAG: efflux RND transporter periplasmic adaptor subunit [Deltaproteobacteria bacterium]|jgi:HlyD family secretion protein|nr:efflux RND transporter periplasmic adaptor subunit [Deltaproteobacteria bacterium]